MLLLIPAFALIALSMIFSATESAFLSINKLRVRVLHNKRDKKAMRVWKLLNDRERLINTLLVGNNIVNIALSSLLTYMAIKLFGNAGVGIATFIVTLLLLVFGEISPKTIATHHPEPIAFRFSLLVLCLEVVLFPLVAVFTLCSRAILQLAGISTKKVAVSFTEEDIKTFIEVSSEQGVIENDEKTMMKRVFKFTDLAAKDIMIPRKNIKAIPLTARYEDIISLSQTYFLSRFPVYRDGIDDIVGILYVKDLLFYKKNTEGFSVQQVMRPPLFILETKKMSSIQQMLRENHQSLAVVIDEYSGTYGVLTSEDIAREICGPMSDEYRADAPRAEAQVQNFQEADIDGLTRLVDVNEQLNTHLSSTWTETIGGYICEALAHIPFEGERIVREGFTFTVMQMDDKRVARVRVRNTVEGGAS